MLQTVTRFLDTLKLDNQQIVVAVSGGPDSMALLWLIQAYYKANKRDQGNICVAHYNHGQRKESIQEQRFLETYCKNNTFYRNTQIPKPSLSETKLRNLRHSFFDKVMKETQASYLFLGHNLTDRIETSILHIVRGASLQGFLGIKKTSLKKIGTTKGKTKGKIITQVRPLLDIPKQDIQFFCDKNKIPYFVDATNSQNITGRNTLRNTIFPAIYTLHTSGKIYGEKNRYQSRKSVYENIENEAITEKNTEKITLSQTNTILKQEKLQTLPPHSSWGASSWYKIPYSCVSENLLYQIITTKQSTKQPTKKSVGIIVSFIESSAKGYLYSHGWYFFKTDNSVHCIDGSKDFWKKQITIHKPIIHSGLLQFDENTYSIKPERVVTPVPMEIRYPQKGDVFKKKTLAKVLLNKKIPVFMRNSIVVIAKGNEIQAILD